MKNFLFPITLNIILFILKLIDEIIYEVSKFIHKPYLLQPFTQGLIQNPVCRTMPRQAWIQYPTLMVYMVHRDGRPPHAVCLKCVFSNQS